MYIHVMCHDFLYNMIMVPLATRITFLETDHEPNVPSGESVSNIRIIVSMSGPSALSSCHTQNCSNESHCKLISMG